MSGDFFPGRQEGVACCQPGPCQVPWAPSRPAHPWKRAEPGWPAAEAAISSPGRAPAGTHAVGLGFNAVETVLERGDEHTAALIVGDPGLFDDRDGCEQRLNRVAVIP